MRRALRLKVKKCRHILTQNRRQVKCEAQYRGETASSHRSCIYARQRGPRVFVDHGSFREFRGKPEEKYRRFLVPSTAPRRAHRTKPEIFASPQGTFCEAA